MYRKLRRFRYRVKKTQERHTRRLKLLGRHPFVVPILAFSLMVAITAGVYWFWTAHKAETAPARTDIVIISYDHHVQTVPSREPTVGALLKKLDIAVNPGDVVEPALDTKINQDDFRINMYRAVPVKIVDGATVTEAYSAASTPRSVAKQAGITVYPEDNLITKPATNFLEEKTVGSVVTIDRSTPVSLSLNGLVSATRTQATTVGGLLTEKNIKLRPKDSVMPGHATPVTANMTVAVLRDGTGIQSATEAVAMPIQYVTDDSLAYGTTAVRQAGSPGQQVSTYKITVLNGQITDRTLIQTVVTVPPVTQIVVRGTNLSGIKGDMARAGIAPGDYTYADYIISHESGWNPASLSRNGCGGLGQACPASKLAAVCTDWQNDPVCQLSYFSGYASRYGGWAGAYNFWVSHHYW
jgi:uncharacterized protein YabE (DUF348 family)